MINKYIYIYVCIIQLYVFTVLIYKSKGVRFPIRLLRCLSLNSVAPEGASTNLVDIVKMENVSNTSQSVSIRDAIYDMAVLPIESQFNGVLGSMTGGTPPALNSTPEFVDLISMIGDLDMPAGAI